MFNGNMVSMTVLCSLWLLPPHYVGIKILGLKFIYSHLFVAILLTAVKQMTSHLFLHQMNREEVNKIIHSEAVNVFCVCRLPWNKNCTSRGSLAQCSVCKEWFHELCMKINKEIIRKPLLKYKCNVCLNKTLGRALDPRANGTW